MGPPPASLFFLRGWYSYQLEHENKCKLRHVCTCLARRGSDRGRFCNLFGRKPDGAASLPTAWSWRLASRRVCECDQLHVHKGNLEVDTLLAATKKDITVACAVRGQNHQNWRRQVCKCHSRQRDLRDRLDSKKMRAHYRHRRAAKMQKRRALRRILSRCHFCNVRLNDLEARIRDSLTLGVQDHQRSNFAPCRVRPQKLRQRLLLWWMRHCPGPTASGQKLK